MAKFKTGDQAVRTFNRQVVDVCGTVTALFKEGGGDNDDGKPQTRCYVQPAVKGPDGKRVQPAWPLHKGFFCNEEELQSLVDYKASL